VDTFEVAGMDLGSDLAGFDDNFHLGTLTLGGADIGLVQLADSFNNGNRGGPGGASESLYVDTLIVGTGSLLGINGQNLYTKYFRSLPVGQYTSGLEGIDFGGGSLFVVPEPTSLLLIALGSLVLLYARKNRRTVVA